MSEAVTRIEDIMLSFSEDTGLKLRALRESHLRTDQKLAETDVRLKALVDAVERFIATGRRPVIKKSATKPRARSY